MLDALAIARVNFNLSKAPWPLVLKAYWPQYAFSSPVFLRTYLFSTAAASSSKFLCWHVIELLVKTNLFQAGCAGCVSDKKQCCCQYFWYHSWHAPNFARATNGHKLSVKAKTQSQFTLTWAMTERVFDQQDLSRAKVVKGFWGWTCSCLWCSVACNQGNSWFLASALHCPCGYWDDLS